MSEGLLTFDEDSPLFVKKKVKKKTAKRKKRKAKPAAIEEVIIDDQPAVKKKRKAKAKPLNPNAPKYKINDLKDCKHILPKFKKRLTKEWNKLASGTLREAGDVSNYIRGVASVAKDKRPKEYEELRLLILVARKKATERNKKQENND